MEYSGNVANEASLIKSSDDPPVAIVTGSSRGIGLAIAQHLAQAGFALVINGRTSSRALADCRDRLIAGGAQVLALPFDIAKIDDHAEMVGRIIERFGRIDCLVNNAGISVRHRGDLLAVSPESFDEQISVNLRSHFFFTQRVALWMEANPSPATRSIITISSSNAGAASITRGEYCIAKSALSMMTKLFAVRLADARIAVFEVKPGLIATDMTAPARADYDNRLAGGFSPINRWGEPDDVARVVRVLAEGRFSFATGNALHVDGGLLISRY